MDPLTQSYPWLTPYQFASNRPIWAIDLDGLESFYVTRWYENNQLRSKVKFTVIESSDGGTKIVKGKLKNKEQNVEYKTTERDGSMTISYSPHLSTEEFNSLHFATDKSVVNKIIKNKPMRTLEPGTYEAESYVISIPPVNIMPPPVTPKKEKSGIPTVTATKKLETKVDATPHFVSRTLTKEENMCWQCYIGKFDTHFDKSIELMTDMLISKGGKIILHPGGGDRSGLWNWDNNVEWGGNETFMDRVNRRFDVIKNEILLRGKGSILPNQIILEPGKVSGTKLEITHEYNEKTK